MMELPFGPGAAHAGTWVALLLEAAAKLTVVLFAVAVGTTVFRRTVAASRHWVWTCTLAGALALPALTVLLPVWPLPIFPETPLWSYAVAKVGSIEAGATAGSASSSARIREPAMATVASPDPVASLDDSHPWRSAILWTWGIGFALVSVWLAAGAWQAGRLRRSARPVRSGAVHAAVNAAAASLGLRIPVPLLVSGQISAPVTMGAFEPVVILPRDALSWPAERLRVVLLHELAHVQRHDCLTQRVADMACAAYWFHPVVWKTAGLLRRERERACDDRVLQAGVAPAVYAEHLLAIARSCTRKPPAHALAMAGTSHLEERLRAILDPTIPHESPGRASYAASVLLIATLLFPLAALDPWSAQPPAESAGDAGSLVDHR